MSSVGRFVRTLNLVVEMATFLPEHSLWPGCFLPTDQWADHDAPPRCLPRSLFIGRGQVTREGGYPYPEALDASKGQNKNEEVENLPATLPALKGPIKIKVKFCMYEISTN